MQEAEKREKDICKDMDLIFDGLIKRGVIIEEREIVKGFKIKVKPLTTGELILAEAVYSSKASDDFLVKVRAASILSKAIISINGNSVENDAFSAEENNQRRRALYNHLLELPMIIVTKAYDFYLECVHKQNNIFEDGQAGEAIENF